MKFNDRAEELQQLRTQFKQMELHLESYEKTFEQMSEEARLAVSFALQVCMLSKSLMQELPTTKPSTGGPPCSTPKEVRFLPTPSRS